VAAVRVMLDLSAPGYRGLHRNSEVLNKQLHDGRFDMTVRPEDIDRIDPIVSQIAPNEANRNRYEADHGAFKALYVNNRATMRRSTAT
jgi:hypothetical protein